MALVVYDLMAGSCSEKTNIIKVHSLRHFLLALLLQNLCPIPRNQGATSVLSRTMYDLFQPGEYV